ncbi:hypothetical protein [Agrococcus sp. Ld7]|uniref:hypothetical protein n=1 Tax=Agrococcus sp. Ld7 TaxID=649148 RepID=UPI00386CC668
MTERTMRTDPRSTIAMLVVIVVVTVALGAFAQLPFLMSGLIAVPAGLVAAGITHLILNRNRGGSSR